MPLRAEQLAHPVLSHGQQQRGQARPGVAADEQVVEPGEEGALGDLDLGGEFLGGGVGGEARLDLGNAVDEVGQAVQGPVRLQSFEEQAQRLAALVVEGLQELGVGLVADDGALLGGDLGVDPGLGLVEPGPDLVQGRERVLGVELAQDAQGLVLGAGGDVGDGGEGAVRHRAGVLGRSPAAVPTARLYAAASAGRTDPSATLPASLSHSS